MRALGPSACLCQVRCHLSLCLPWSLSVSSNLGLRFALCLFPPPPPGSVPLSQKSRGRWRGGRGSSETRPLSRGPPSPSSFSQLKHRGRGVVSSSVGNQGGRKRRHRAARAQQLSPAWPPVRARFCARADRRLQPAPLAPPPAPCLPACWGPAWSPFPARTPIARTHAWRPCAVHAGGESVLAEKWVAWFSSARERNWRTDKPRILQMEVSKVAFAQRR